MHKSLNIHRCVMRISLYFKRCRTHGAITSYSQTFENKSSLPPKPPPPPPPPCLLCAGRGLVLAGVSGAALLHPPKSSSGVTLGACEVLPHVLLELEDSLFEEVGVPPHAEKSLDIGMDGPVAGATVLGLGGEVEVGSGAAHASLEPHASILLRPEEGAATDAVGLDAGCAGATGAERLKGELKLEEGGPEGFAGTGAGCGALFAGDGSAKSNRSLEALTGTGFGGVGAEGEAKLKSPKSFVERGPCLA